jgi:hypothetical protein
MYRRDLLINTLLTWVVLEVGVVHVEWSWEDFLGSVEGDHTNQMQACTSTLVTIKTKTAISRKTTCSAHCMYTSYFFGPKETWLCNLAIGYYLYIRMFWEGWVVLSSCEVEGLVGGGHWGRQGTWTTHSHRDHGTAIPPS